MAGCALFPTRTSNAPQYRPRAFALAVTVNGVLLPTPQQWAAVQAKAAQVLAAHGWVVVSDLALADHILRIDFTPNPNDPENSGHAQVLGIRPNPRLAIASTTSVGRYPSSFSYLGHFQNASWGYNGFNSSHFGWANSHYDGYSYSSANLNPTTAPLPPTTKPTHPPHRPHPGNRDDCPSPWNLQPRPNRPRDDLASHVPNSSTRTIPTTDAAHGRGGEGTSTPARTGYSRSEGSNWRPGSSASPGERTASRADPSPSRLDRSSWRSGSTDSPRAERGYSRSDSSDGRSGRSYSNSDSSRAWQDHSGSSSPSSSSSGGSRSERGYSRSDWSGGNSDRTYSRSDSSHPRSDSTSYSRSDSSHSHSGGSMSHSSPAAASSPPPSAVTPTVVSDSAAGAK